MSAHTFLLSMFYAVSIATALLVGATTYMQANDPTTHMLALSGRLVLLLGNTLLLYVLTAGTSYLREKRYGLYLARFAPFYMSVLSALLLDSVFGISVIIATSRNEDQQQVQSKAWFWICAVAMQLSYCVQVTCSGLTAGRVGIDSAR